MLIDPRAVPIIIAIGDSVTRGYPDNYSWTNVAATRLGMPIENLGISGDTFSGILLRLDKDVVEKSPDFCIITAGTNDISLGYSLDEIKKTIKEIIKKLELEGIIPIIGTPIPILDEYTEKQTTELRDWIVTVCPYTINFHKAFEARSLLSGHLLIDGVHPTHEGHDRMGEICASALHKYIEELRN